MVGTNEGRYYFQGKLTIPDHDMIQCCLLAKGSKHQCARTFTQQAKQIVRWTISQDYMSPDDCTMIDEIVLKHAVYVGQIFLTERVESEGYTCEHSCICFRVDDALSQVIPRENPKATEWAMIELFAGGFGGWKQASKVLQSRGAPCSSTHAVELDPVVASLYCHNLGIQQVLRASDECMIGPGMLPSENTLHDTMFIGDVADTLWMKTIPRNKKLIAAMSSPCPPWTATSEKDGLMHDDGKLFVQTFFNLRLCKPTCIVIENVANIRSHRHFETLLRVASWCGYKMIWETISDLRKVAPVSRKRWLAVFVVNEYDGPKWQSLDFLQLPETSLNLFRVMVPLPEAHEKELTLDAELLQVYSNPMYLAAGRNGNRGPKNPKQVLDSRVKTGSSCVGTIMAMYGSQHCLPPKLLASKGMFTELWQGTHGIRFFSPAECAILHGVIVDFAFPVASKLGHSSIGNCISVPHAVLALSLARNVVDPNFNEDPRETVMAGLLLRLNATNAEVLDMGNMILLAKKQTMPNEMNQQMSCEQCEDEVDITQLDLSQTLSFTCGYQVKITIGLDDVQIFHVDPGTTLNMFLRMNELTYLGNMLALDSNGQVFPMDREVTEDVDLKFLWCDALVKDVARRGGTWKICKQPFEEVPRLVQIVNQALHVQIVCRDTMLNTFEGMAPCISEAILLFLGCDMPTFSLAGFQIRSDTPPELFSQELQRLLPVFRVAHDQVVVAAHDAAVIHEAVANCDRILGPLLNIFLAIGWEWNDDSHEDGLVIGSFKPTSDASPVLALMNPICKSMIHVALAPSVCSDGTQVELSLEGLSMWEGTLHSQLSVHQLFDIVKAVIAASGRPHFVTSVNGIRIDEDSHATLTSLQGEMVKVSFKMSSVSIGSTLRLWGGGGRVDVWKETKMLLGQTLLSRGWSVAGLDDETTKWIRAIGQNKLFGILRQQLTDEKRWDMLVDSAKWHGIKTTPEDDTRERAAQRIQRAMRQNMALKLTAAQFTLCDGYFVDGDGEHLQVLPGISLDASGVCFMELEAAMGWLTQKLPIISDELAVVTLFNQNLPSTVPVPTDITFPALDGRGRQVLLKGQMWQLGEKHAKPGPKEREIETSDTVTMAATIWKDSCSESQWNQVTKSLVRFTFDQLFEGDGRKIVLQVWGRSFRNERGRTEPESSISAQFHFRIPQEDAEGLLKCSGKSVVFLTPKAENHMSHPGYGLLWFKDFREAEIAAARATQHSGFARTKTRFALRVPIQLLDQIAKEVKDSSVSSSIQVLFLYKVHPIPHDIKPEQVVEWALGFDWKVKLIKKLGKDAVLLGASSKVPFPHMSMNGRPVLIKEIITQKNKDKSPLLVAGPRPAPPKSQAVRGVDTLVESDPWAPWASQRKKALEGDGDSASSAPSTAITNRSVDAPTAAKFQAIEQRMATFEANMTQLSKTSQFQTAAIEATNNVVCDLKNHLYQVDQNVQTMNQQMAGALEVAVAKGLEAQEKKMDTKFDQLMKMLSNSTSSGSKRNSTAAHEVVILDPEDHDMESPVKEPQLKKEK
eukprot:Skav203623  [mRNA]  locus=scaffold935:865684:870291:+ [translate_table: standard]